MRETITGEYVKYFNKFSINQRTTWEELLNLTLDAMNCDLNVNVEAAKKDVPVIKIKVTDYHKTESVQSYKIESSGILDKFGDIDAPALYHELCKFIMNEGLYKRAKGKGKSKATKE